MGIQKSINVNQLRWDSIRIEEPTAAQTLKQKMKSYFVKKFANQSSFMIDDFEDV